MTEPSDQPAVQSEAVRAAGGGVANIAGAAFSSAARLVITLLIARLLDESAVGLYYIAIAIHDLLALVCSGGFQTALTRFVAQRLASDDEAGLRGMLHLGRVIPTVAACAVAILTAAVSGPLANGAFDQPPLRPLLLLVALVLPASVFADVTLAAARGYRTMRQSAAIGLFLEPALRLLLTVVAIQLGMGITGALVALVITNYVAAVVASIWVNRLTGRLETAPRYEARTLLSFAALSWASTVAIDAFIWADTILLGLMRSPREVGLYQVATRLVLLSAIFVMPFTQAVAPRVSDLFERNRLPELRSLYVTVTGWVVRLVILPTLVLIFFPEELLSIFGPSFQQAAEVTVILAVGALIHATTGPSGAMLNMTGRPKWALANNVTTVFVNIVLNLVLIPSLGITGAAIAWTSSLLFTNALVAWQIHRALGVHAFGTSFGRTFAAATPATIIGFGLQRITDGVIGALIATVCIVGTYLATLKLLGISDEDRDLWRTLNRRLSLRRT